MPARISPPRAWSFACRAEPQGLDEIALGETVLFEVIGHPPGEAGQFCRRGEKLPADCVRIPAVT